MHNDASHPRDSIDQCEGVDVLARSGSAEAPLEFREEADSFRWDELLAKLGGHPLQSALWGDARRQVDGIEDRRWIVMAGGRPVWMARVEDRRIRGLGSVAWIPRGPTGELSIDEALPLVTNGTGNRKFSLVVTDEWAERDPAVATAGPLTAWVDLSVGAEALKQKLAKIRHGVARADRAGLSIAASSKAGEVQEFYSLCRQIGAAKQFYVSGSAGLMLRLVERRSESVEARLFLAWYRRRIAGGAFMIRCGRSLHYFWGATDRSAGSIDVGEALQWAAIEWGIAAGCARYDVEGLDPERNPGTYMFKSKLGGREVRLRGTRFVGLNARGRCLAFAHGLFGHRFV